MEKRNINKIIAHILLIAAIFSLILRVTPVSAQSSTSSTIGGCLEWELRWTDEGIPSNPDRIGKRVPSNTTDPPLKNPVKAGEGGSSGSAKPKMPTGILSSEAGWFCSNDARASKTTKTGEDEVQGMELCYKAAEISSKWGGFTSLDYVQKDLIDSMKGSLEGEIGSVLKIDGFKLDAGYLISKGIGDVTGFLKDKFNELFVNKAKETVAKQVDELKNAAKKELEEIGKEFIKDTLGDIAGDITGGILGKSSIPVKDEELIKETILIKERAAELIAEQKRAIVVQDTRDKCSLLYKKTVDTIKRSILYQFSTQITDWIVKDEKPQFIKNPGKFLEDTARLAVDRTISRIAPNLCEPFRLNVQIQIPTVAREANPFYEQITCTLDQFTSNIENFYNDFRDGGWVAYQEMWKPQNNYFGAMMMIEGELAAQQQAALQAAQDDLNRGEGFRSERQCTEWTIHKKVDCPSAGPDGTVTASMRRIMEITEMDGDDCYKTEVFEEDPPEDGSPPPLPAGSDDYYTCTKSEITTPSSLTSDLSKRAQQTDFDYISQMQSDDIENFFETIENAIINKLVKSGVKGLQGLLKGLPEIRL